MKPPSQEVEMSEQFTLDFNYADYIPFPIIPVKKDSFDVCLEQFNNSKYKYMLAFVSDQCGNDKVQDITYKLASYDTVYVSDTWIGQDDLYPQLEQVLTTLMSDPKHKCFLQRVTIKEAPDYFKIIKTPMDFSKIMKKFKNCDYKSKEQLRADIELIADNCLLYNVDPNNIYRLYAESLKERANILLNRIPSITIKHISTLDDNELKDLKEKKYKDFLSKNTSKKRTIPPLTHMPYFHQ